MRNNSIHAAAVVIADRPLTEIVPLQLAEDRGGPDANGDSENGGQARARLQDGDAVLDGPDRGDRPAEDGLPGIAHARRARERGRRSSSARAASAIDLDEPAARRPQDLRDAGARRLGGRVPARVRGHAGGAEEGAARPSSTTSSRWSRSTARARCASSRTTRAASAIPPSVRYIDERLRSITEPTYGIALYQEQLMQIARDIAGFPGPKADTLRARDRQEEARPDGEPEAGLHRRLQRERHVLDASANQLWALMESAADYSFNRSHAACYALIAYRTAYLKANYPAEYMAALISSVMSTKDKVPFFVSRCEEMGIDVLPPDVNAVRSRLRGRRGRHPLRARRRQERRLRGGREDPRGARGGRPFTSIWDFCARVDCRTVNKKAIESLIKCGALDSTGATRKGMLSVLPQAQGVGREGAGGRAVRPGLDLRPRPRGAARRRRPRRRTTRRCRPRSSSASSCSRWRRRRSASSSPAIRSPRSATCCASAPTARWPRWRRSPDGAWVTVGGLITAGEADPHQVRRADDVRDARRPRGPGRDADLQLRLREQRVERRASTSA